MTRNPTDRIYTPMDLYAANADHWLGYPMLKSPLDLFKYHNIIYDVKPDVIVECGTWRGGSALFYASILDQLNHGIVITIDVFTWSLHPRHDRIFYINKSSVDEETAGMVNIYTSQSPRVLVSLDSDHSKEHVLKEMDIYGPMVTPGSYMVVEDTNIHGHPIRMDLPEGPWEAVHEWLPNHPEFVIDHNVQPAYTNNPDGWLRKVK